MSAKIYVPKGKAREYSPLALNYYKGCDHGCIYCYVPPMMSRFNSNYNHSNVFLGKTKEEILKSIEYSAMKLKVKQQVLLNFTSDPYNHLEEDECLTRDVLKILLKHRIPTVVLTKNPVLALRDIDLFSQFESFSIGTTLTFFSEENSKVWETNAISGEKRIKALMELKQSGLKTWVSFEPVINIDESLRLLYYVIDRNAVDYVKIGKLNNFKGLDKKMDWYDFLKKSVNLCRDNDLPFYIKNDLAAFKNDIELFSHETDIDYLTLK